MSPTHLAPHRPYRPRALGGLAASALAVTLLAGCAGGFESSGEAAQDGASAIDTTRMVTIGASSDIGSIDPLIDSSLASNNVYHAVFDQLVRVSADGEIEPRLATSWVANEDATEWTFSLRDDATFHDGTPVTAEDVAYSFTTVQANPESRNATYTAVIQSVVVTSPTEITFTLTQPNAAFARVVYQIGIVPKAVYEAVGPDGFAQEPVGSGPYAVVSYTPGVSLVLEAYDGYWDGERDVENVTIIPVPDADARVNGLLSGEIDVAAVSPFQLEAFEGSDSVTVTEEAGNQLVFLGFNSGLAPLDDPAFRRAIDLAVDREAIVEQILGGYATAGSSSSLAPAVFGGDASLPVVEQDLAEAKALVAASGYDGTPIPFDYPTDGNIAASSEIAQAIAGQLEAAGIVVELKGNDGASHNTLWMGKGFTGIYLNQFAPSNMDANGTFTFLYGPTGKAMFTDPAVDDIIARSGSAVDPEIRRGVVGEMWELNAAQTYVSNLYYSDWLTGVNADIDFETRADGQLDVWDLKFAD